ncbi:MAG: MFS transporter [Holophagaceae bacterium]|nr:MFS transporter [Holophagaceae bacterium]
MSEPEPEPSLIRRLALVRKGETRILAWAAAYFFFLLMSFYLLRPMREAFGIARGADKLPWLMTATMATMLLANPLYAALVSRIPRRRFIPLTYRFFAANMALFWLAFRFLPTHGGVWVGYAFYVWLSVFNLFVVSVFWSLLDDLLTEDMGKRLFGLIAVGGTLGAIAGASLTAKLSQGFSLGTLHLQVAPSSLLLIAILFLEAAVFSMKGLAARASKVDLKPATPEPGPGIFEGLRLVATSRYLQAICLYILLFTVTSTFLYLIQGRIVEQTFQGQAARTAAFASLDLWTNALTLVIQVLLSGRILSGLGLRTTLCLLPLLTLVSLGGLWALPTFAMLALVQVSRRGLHYAVDRPAREILYIPLGQGEKYKSKPFIDTFVYRGGDVLGVWTPTLLALIAVPVGAVGIAVSAGWLATAVWLGRLRDRIKPAGNP